MISDKMIEAAAWAIGTMEDRPVNATAVIRLARAAVIAAEREAGNG